MFNLVSRERLLEMVEPMVVEILHHLKDLVANGDTGDIADVLAQDVVFF